MNNLVILLEKSVSEQFEARIYYLSKHRCKTSKNVKIKKE